MIAFVSGLEPGEFVHTFGDVHLYNNHIEQAEEQLKRKPKPLPKLKFNPDRRNLFDFKFEDFEILDYNPDPAIKAPVSV